MTMSEPTTEAGKRPYTEQDIDDIQWLVWYARKVKGRSREVARQALDENPFIRPSEARAEGYKEGLVKGLTLYYAAVLRTDR
jgi:hypothetical protein